LYDEQVQLTFQYSLMRCVASFTLAILHVGWRPMLGGGYFTTLKARLGK
jgi:hypothetical protein